MAQIKQVAFPLRHCRVWPSRDKFAHVSDRVRVNSHVGRPMRTQPRYGWLLIGVAAGMAYLWYGGRLTTQALVVRAGLAVAIMVIIAAVVARMQKR